MNMATAHPQYDIMGELLCLLPTARTGAFVPLLMADLGLNERQITQLARRAAREGIKLNVSNKSGFRYVSFCPYDDAGQAAALEYWNKVYEGQACQ